MKSWQGPKWKELSENKHYFEMKNWHGVKWKELDEDEQYFILLGALTNAKEGECTVDLIATDGPFSVAGKWVDGELVIDDDATIYNGEIGVID